MLPKNIEIKIYKTLILPAGLYGCETWMLILKEECRLRVFENMVLRRIFGPKRYEVTGGWRKLHNKELNELYSSPNIIQVIASRRMVWGVCSKYGGEERCIQGFGEKTQRKRSLRRTRHRWDNIKIDLQEEGCGGMDWIDLAQDRDKCQALVNTVMYL